MQYGRRLSFSLLETFCILVEGVDLVLHGFLHGLGTVKGSDCPEAVENEINSFDKEAKGFCMFIKDIEVGIFHRAV